MYCVREQQVYYNWEEGIRSGKERKQNMYTSDIYDQRVSDRIVLLILPVQNDALEYLN